MSGRLAQLVEHQSYKLGVVGSNPAPPTTKSMLFVAYSAVAKAMADFAGPSGSAGYAWLGHFLKVLTLAQ